MQSVHFFCFCEFDLLRQWDGLGYDDLAVFGECLAEVSLDGGGGELDVFLRGGDAGVSGDALDGVDVHAEVGQPSDARAACGVDGDLLRASDVCLAEHVLDEPVDGRVPLEAYDVLHRLVTAEYLHRPPVEDDGERYLHEYARLHGLDGEPRLGSHLSDVLLRESYHVAVAQSRIAGEQEEVACAADSRVFELIVQQFLHLGEAEHVGAVAHFGYLVEPEGCLPGLQQVALDGFVEEHPQHLHPRPDGRLGVATLLHPVLVSLEPLEVDVLHRYVGREVVDVLHDVAVAVESNLSAACAVLEHVLGKLRQGYGGRQCFDVHRIEPLHGHVDVAPEGFYLRGLDVEQYLVDHRVEPVKLRVEGVDVAVGELTGLTEDVGGDVNRLAALRGADHDHAVTSTAVLLRRIENHVINDFV